MSIIVSGASVRGERHKQSGQPCQDAYAVSGTGNRWGIALADGLGCVGHADCGARIAVDTAVEALLNKSDSPDFVAEERVRQAFLKAREAVLSEAEERGIPSSEFASTLIAASYSDGRITIGHIGDGIAVGISDGHAFILSPPGESEYANETASLVQSDWEEQLRITPTFDIDHALFSTDGCQGAVAVKQAGSFKPHEPFILPLLSYIAKKHESHQNPEPDISALLSSKKMQDLSGDDKTLVILFRELKLQRES